MASFPTERFWIVLKTWSKLPNSLKDCIPLQDMRVVVDNFLKKYVRRMRSIRSMRPIDSERKLIHTRLLARSGFSFCSDGKGQAFLSCDMCGLTIDYDKSLVAGNDKSEQKGIDCLHKYLSRDCNEPERWQIVVYTADMLLRLLHVGILSKSFAQSLREKRQKCRLLPKLKLETTYDVHDHTYARVSLKRKSQYNHLRGPPRKKLKTKR